MPKKSAEQIEQDQAVLDAIFNTQSPEFKAVTLGEIKETLDAAFMAPWLSVEELREALDRLAEDGHLIAHLGSIASRWTLPTVEPEAVFRVGLKGELGTYHFRGTEWQRSVDAIAMLADLSGFVPDYIERVFVAAIRPGAMLRIKKGAHDFTFIVERGDL